MSESIRRQKIVENNSIAEVIGEYLQQRDDGSGLRSPCPFHDDQLSTFGVDLATRSFKCSACGAAGDVVEFVQLYDGVTVSKALGMLEARLSS
jgi:DNA primase